MLDAAALTSSATYDDTVLKSFGSAGRILMLVLTTIVCGTAVLAYVSAGKTLLVKTVVAFVLDVDTDASNIEVLSKLKSDILLVLLVASVCPLCLSDSIGDSQWISRASVVVFSLVTLVFAVYAILAMVFGCESMHASCGELSHAFTTDPSVLLQYLGTLAFGLSLILAMFPVLQARLQANVPFSQDVRGLKPAVHFAVVLCGSLQMIVGLTGSLVFGQKCNTIAIDNLPVKILFMQFITLIAGVISVLVAPIIMIPGAKSLKFFLGCIAGESSVFASQTVAVLITAVAIVVLSAALNESIVVALCGSLGLSTIAYVVPCIVALCRADRTCVCINVVVVLLGLLLFFGSTPVTVYNAMDGGPGHETQSLKKAVCETFSIPGDD